MKPFLRFSVKNAAYALKTSEGYAPPISIGFSDSIAFDPNYNEQTIIGDGRTVVTIPNDKGKTGTLGLLAIDDAYEIAMGRRMKTANGIAEIKQTKSVEHAIYFEFEFFDEDEKQKTAKTIVYGVTSGRPSETFNQTTENINNNIVSYPLTVKGVPVMSNDGKTPYKDIDGNIVYVWQETSIPGDSGYEEFGKTITAPKVAPSNTDI